MWSEELEEFNNNNKQILNFKLDLHSPIYIKEIFKNKIKFSISENKSKTKQSVVITLFDKQITTEQFFYWYQIDLFDELYSEEEIIFNEYNNLKIKITKVIQKIKNPIISKSDSEEDKNKKNYEIEDNNNKIKKLNEHLKRSADKSWLNDYIEKLIINKIDYPFWWENIRILK